MKHLSFSIRWQTVLLHLIENTFDQKSILANPSSYPNPNSNSNTNTNPNPNPNAIPNPIPNPNPKAQYRFSTDETTSFFDQVYRTVTNSSSKSRQFENLHWFN